jgi:hypothetical protein
MNESRSECFGFHLKAVHQFSFLSTVIFADHFTDVKERWHYSLKEIPSDQSVSAMIVVNDHGRGTFWHPVF